MTDPHDPSSGSDDLLPASTFDPREGLPWPGVPVRRRFVHRYPRHVLLFLLTLVTTTWSGSCQYAGWAADGAADAAPLLVSLFGVVVPTWAGVLGGLWYSVPLLAILGSHEFGHYLYCRYHQVDATLPYFIPAPVPMTGTLGAVIRIREPFPSKAALFDIGIAGPIAGFVVLVPILFWGMGMSALVRIPENTEVLYFGEPLLLQAVAWLQFGSRPEGFDVVLHPMGFAAWWGLLATALNLLPFGQLDGGHISYSLFGRRASIVSAATLAGVVLLTLGSISWISMTVILLIMSLVLGFGHPRVIDEHVPLDPRRRLVALAALVIFLLSFTPVPIDIFVN